MHEKPCRLDIPLKIGLCQKIGLSSVKCCKTSFEICLSFKEFTSKNIEILSYRAHGMSLNPFVRKVDFLLNLFPTEKLAIEMLVLSGQRTAFNFYIVRRLNFYLLIVDNNKIIKRS